MKLASLIAGVVETPAVREHLFDLANALQATVVEDPKEADYFVVYSTGVDLKTRGDVAAVDVGLEDFTAELWDQSPASIKHSVNAAALEVAPGHTDLMVSPEAIDAFLDAEPAAPKSYQMTAKFTPAQVDKIVDAVTPDDTPRTRKRK